MADRKITIGNGTPLVYDVGWRFLLSTPSKYMLLHIPQMLSAEQVNSIHTALAQGTWTDGALSAGAQAKNAKHNQQLDAQDKFSEQPSQLIEHTIRQNPLFLSAAIAQHITPPRFNRYTDNGHYGNHVDAALQWHPNLAQKIRTDISITVFLSDPQSYDGGELIIEDTYGEHLVKLDAGDAILYPATSLHRVEPVTRGQRLASFFWVQSWVKDAAQRRMLFELDMTILKLRQTLGDNTEVVALTNHYHNLLREWSAS